MSKFILQQDSLGPPKLVKIPINMPVKISEILRNNVKDKLARDEVVASMTVRLVRGVEIARIAKTAGFDTLYVDIEHSSFSLETTSQICIAALEVGIAPFVRVPGVAEIQRVLDGGALGVIAPHVGSADGGARGRAAAKFPPLGERSASRGRCRICITARSRPPRANAALNDGDHGHRAVRDRRGDRPRPTRSSRSRASTWC